MSAVESAARRAATYAIEVEALVYDEELEAALGALRTAADALTDLGAELAQAAFNDGMTKRAIAEALDVPPSTFRGMTKTPAARS